ncbi:TadE family type IV pilus minor pilin [Leifsonia sp. NPDC058248]|uniref:TadE family type IV pilus minor pilin n=1 Tax=Leifsonia sp. NPDC058248 TaxID=3346402 RepID=UPI0036DB29BD
MASLPLRDERGSVTAEFAVVLPAVLVCLGLCMGAIQAVAQQVRLTDAAAVAARALGRGDDADGIVSRSGAAIETERTGGLLCVRLTAASSVAGLGPLGVSTSARACALDDSAPGAG